MKLLDWVADYANEIGLGGPGSGFYRHKGRKGKEGGSTQDEDTIPNLSVADQNLIERASSENANSFNTQEKKRLSQIIKRQRPLPRDKVVYRGIDVDADGRFQGEKWTNPRFISTSTSRDVALRYSRLDYKVVRITIPKGTRVLDYADYGYWGNAEVLLDMNTKFEALSNNHWRIKK